VSENNGTSGTSKPLTGADGKPKSAKSKKPFKIHGADGHVIEHPAGRFYFNTKERELRLCLNSLSSNARRVYACVELGTMGYRQEFAVITLNKKKRPMSPAYIAHRCKMPKQRVREALVELEQAGLIERRSDDGGPLRNGHILIYSWAVPRQAGTKKGSGAPLPFPKWFETLLGPEIGPTVKNYINRRKLTVVVNEVAARDYLLEAQAKARSYLDAEKELARFCEKICAPRPPNSYKDRGKEKHKETAAATDSGKTVARAAAAEPAPSIPNGKTGAATARTREPEAKAEPITPILEAFKPVGGITDKRACQLVQACRGATSEEIAAKAAELTPGILKNPKAGSGFAILLSQLREFFAGVEAVAQWRADRQRAAPATEPPPMNDEQRQLWMEHLAAHPEEKEHVREMFPEWFETKGAGG